MSVNIDPKEVLNYLNELGYCDITKKQLKEFIRDLKTLIKHDQKIAHKNNQENLQPVYSQGCYSLDQSEQDYFEPEIEHITKNINSTRDDNYMSEVFNTLHSASTISSRAKSLPKHENIISVQILKPKSSRPLSSTCTNSTNKCSEKPVSSHSCSKINEYFNSKSEPLYYSKDYNTAKPSNDPLRPKVSFIRPRRPVKTSKSDPVALYQQYQTEWKKQKLPGEDKRYDLRWAVREKMLGDPEIQPRISMEKISRKQSRI